MGLFYLLLFLYFSWRDGEGDYEFELDVEKCVEWKWVIVERMCALQVRKKRCETWLDERVIEMCGVCLWTPSVTSCIYTNTNTNHRLQAGSSAIQILAIGTVFLHPVHLVSFRVFLSLNSEEQSSQGTPDPSDAEGIKCFY